MCAPSAIAEVYSLAGHPGKRCWANVAPSAPPADNLCHRMSFPLGKPILVMVAVAALTGVAVALRPAPPPSDLTMWVFADAHAREYRTLCTSTSHPLPSPPRIETVSNLALTMRLTSLINTADAADRPPDVVEIEIASLPHYFRPPADQVGFLPLNDRLATTGLREIPSLDAPGQPNWHARLRPNGSGPDALRPDNRIYTFDATTSRWLPDPTRTRPDAWIDRIVPPRLAPWTKSGVIFGVPHDVHPVTLTYRHDLFTEAGIDLPAATTWPQFQDACLRFQHYWRTRGYRDRYAMELPLVSAENVIVMLLQRGVNVVDSDGYLHVRDAKVAQTIAFYAQLVAGPRRIGVESSGGQGVWARDLVDGNTCALITPDWKVADLKTYAPQLSGKLRMMPLPVFDPRDARTSTWGGTMAAIPRRCKDPDAAWRLLEFLYLSDEARAARRATGSIVPPLPEDYTHPDYHRPDPYFGGQRVMELYTQLAPEIPARHVSPLTVASQIATGVVLGRAVDHVHTRGQPGLEQACADWLEEAESGLRARQIHGRLGEN
jgi:ABC-type glycerol-3-phosphate transport system substrate-binding protein